MPSFLFSATSRRAPLYLLLKPLSSARHSSTATATRSKVPSRSHGDSNPPVLLFKQLSHSSSWLNKWPYTPEPFPSTGNPVPPGSGIRVPDGRSRAGGTSIERIVLRLRNLGLGSDDEEDEGDEGNGEDKLGDLLKRDWISPDSMLEYEDVDGGFLPLEVMDGVEKVDGVRRRMRKRTAKEYKLAELTLGKEELRRLIRHGMTLKEKITVPKAGVTGAVLEKIHEKWRKNELVRLKFHEALAHDKKTAHKIVERRTNGLVIWRSGSIMLVYRGNNYQGPKSSAEPNNIEVNSPLNNKSESFNPAEEKSIPLNSIQCKTMTAKEAEFDRLLGSLGPRYEDWWGTGILPVDADLLPQKVPGYKSPFRLLPNRMRHGLTNAEMTNLRKLTKSLPCHFALGRNRHHQGLAAAIIKLWEKSLIVKIAVKRGVQNTNNELMSEELKKLTGGVLLLRNKFYIVMYRGKDFVPPSVAAAIEERQEITKRTMNVDEMVRRGPAKSMPLDKYGEDLITRNSTKPPEAKDTEEKQRRWPATAPPVGNDEHMLVGSLAEFYEAQARGRELPNMSKEVGRTKTERIIKRLEHKYQLERLKAEYLLSKNAASWVPAGPSDHQETITKEERVVYHQVGLKMKTHLPLGIRGVVDGAVENMHLHWKHRELVKLISKEKELAFVEGMARRLEHESGGVLVAIDRVPKGHSLVFHRGKSYRRPISIRPKNLPRLRQRH